jgi:hypothetical protein
MIAEANCVLTVKADVIVTAERRLAAKAAAT